MLLKITIILLCTVSTISGHVSNLNTPFPIACQDYADERIHIKLFMGGEDAYPGDQSYAVALQFIKNKTHFCAGTIIATSVILTAAHCIVKKLPEEIQVHHFNFLITKKVKKVIPHPRFQIYPMLYDIGLVILSSPLTFTSMVSYMKLPNYNTGLNVKLVVTGYRKLNDLGMDDPKFYQVQVSAISKMNCETHFPKKRIIFDQQICTITLRKTDVCIGNPGSPVVDKYSVVGVVSWSRLCAVWKPDVVIRVHYFVKWIKKHLATEDILLP